MLVVALNLTPVPRSDYRIGAPHGGKWRCVFSSDAGLYGGSDFPTRDVVTAEDCRSTDGCSRWSSSCRRCRRSSTARSSGASGRWSTLRRFAARVGARRGFAAGRGVERRVMQRAGGSHAPRPDPRREAPALWTRVAGALDRSREELRPAAGSLPVNRSPRGRPQLPRTGRQLLRGASAAAGGAAARRRRCAHPVSRGALASSDCGRSARTPAAQAVCWPRGGHSRRSAAQLRRHGQGPSCRVRTRLSNFAPRGRTRSTSAPRSGAACC